MHPTRFTLIAFLSWLHTLPVDKIIGNVNHSRLCPLANFLLAVSGRASLVRTRVYQSPSWGPVEELPEWAAQFTFLLDYRYMVDENGVYCLLNSVTVQQCIEVLSTVHYWETGAVMLRPHAITYILPFSVLSSPCTPHATRPTFPFGSVLFAPISTSIQTGVAADDDLSCSWLVEGGR